MKTIKNILVFGFLALLMGCSSIQLVAPKPQNYSGLGLGMIGERNSMLKGGFEVKAYPKATKKWAVHLVEMPFSKSTFKHYQEAKGHRISTIKYVDSLAIKPTYFSVELVDDLKLANTINVSEDKDVFAFAKANTDTRIITQISGVLEGEPLPKTGVWYLETNSDGGIELRCYRNKELIYTIDFSETTVFDYELSFLCWGLDTRGKIKVFDLVEEGKTCQKPLTRKVRQLTKEKNIYTF